MKYCTHCGATQEDGAVFCAHCGSTVFSQTPTNPETEGFAQAESTTVLNEMPVAAFEPDDSTTVLEEPAPAFEPDDSTTVLEEPASAVEPDDSTTLLEDASLQQNTTNSVISQPGFEATATGTAGSQNNVVQQNTYRAPQQSNTVEQNAFGAVPAKKKGGKKVLIIVIAALVAVIAIALVVFFVLGGKNDKVENNSSIQTTAASSQTQTTAAVAEEEVSIGDVDTADAASVLEFAPYWLTDSEQMQTLNGKKLTKITVNAKTAGTMTIKGCDIDFDKTATPQELVERAKSANSQAFDIAVIALESGKHTYTFDGADSHVKIISQSAIDVCPTTLGFMSPTDTGVPLYNANVSGTGHHNFCFDGESAFYETRSLAFVISYESAE